MKPTTELASVIVGIKVGVAEQITPPPVIGLSEGRGFTKTIVVAVATQPFASVTVMVYVPA